MIRRKKDWVLGIDLGTTNTAAVAFGPDDEQPVSILHGRNQPVIPSVVSLKNPQLPLVGWLAKDMMLTDPLTTVYGWKRFIGRTERSEYVNRFRDRFPFRIHADPGGRLGAVVGQQVHTFIYIASLVLDQVRLQASAAVGEDISKCVITVPAHFANHQRLAVAEAGRMAGLEVMRILNEPTAAALAFGMDQRLETRILVFDLGGGTFDSTILELTDNIFEVRGTRGHGFLGGIDFDRAVRDRLAEWCLSKHKVDVSEEPVVGQRLLNAAENAKCQLSADETVKVRVPMIGHDRKGRPFDLDYDLTRGELERLTAPLVERTIGIVEEMLKESHLEVRDIDHVIVVGGQSKMPLVRKRIEETLGRAPLTHLDPDTTIAQGAALVAKAEGDLAGAILLDVLSVPIGVVFPGGKTQWVFESNSRLPAKKHVPLPTGGQGRDLAVGVWQGPDITSSERQVLGVVKIPSHLTSAGDQFALDFTLQENLELQVNFSSTVQRAVLDLEPPNRA